MSGIFSAGGAGAVGASGSFYPVTIDDSLRFEDGGAAHLTRTPAVAGSLTTWTWSGWVKRGNLAAGQPARGTIFSGQAVSLFGFFNPSTNGAADNFGVYMDAGEDDRFMTNRVFRDTSAWYHLVVVWDSTNGTAGDRFRLYVNGVRETSWSRFDTVTQNRTAGINAAALHGIGVQANAGSQFFDGYMSDINFIDGQALDSTSFGETKDGVWIPKSYAGTYGTNGFHLELNGNTTDSSGNGNNWTANNISAHDYVPDTPTNNFATLNPVFPHLNITFSEGNLRWTTTSNSRGAMGNFSIPIGTGQKYYFEYVQTGWANVSGDDAYVGLNVDNVDIDSARGGRPTSYSYGANAGNKVINGTQTSYGVAWGTGDIIGIAVDRENNTVNFAKNNAYQGTFAIPATGNLFAWIGSGGGFNAASGVWNFGQDSTFAGNTTAGGNADGNGVGDFKYAPPSGFLALCTANLPEPTIVDGSEHFNTALWTGNGSTQSITGVGFQPDVTWIKSRNVAYYHRIMDSVRGISNALYTNSTDSEGTFSAYDGLTSFDADGFTSDSKIGTNETGTTYVGWNWKAGTAFSNSAGSNGATIASSGSVNTDAGFSIVSYVGTGSAGTVYHGLSSTPEFITIKDRDYASGRPWGSYHFKLNNGVNPEDERIQLNESTSETGDTYIFNSTAPTSNVFSLGNSSWNNTSGNDIIAYCFHSVEGYSKVGQYIGIYNVDGPFVYTGFRPAFILIKSAVTSGYSWYMMDSTRTAYNGSQAWLSPDQTNTDDTSTGENVDILSNGFKIRTNWTRLNDSASPRYIYIAFAENPFKYANAR